MLTGFEKETEELTKDEMALTRTAWKAMNNAFKSGRSINNGEIRSAIKEETGKNVAPARIRKMINWMHTSGHLSGLIANSSGYSMAESKKDLADYADSLKGRITAIQKRLNAVNKDLNNYQQQDMFQQPNTKL